MATKSILVHLNFNGNEIQNVLAQKLATPPASASAGQFYYNTTDNTLYVYNGTVWLNALSQGAVYTSGSGIDIDANNEISVDFTAVVSTSTTVNGQALSSNVTLDANDVGALPDTTTINDLTSSAQQNALNSGITSALVTQIGTNQTDISTINDKIPSQASSSNQLADKDFVNSSISTSTATFRGTYNSLQELEAQTADDNDYGFVISTDAAGNTVYSRYKYNGTAWVFEYDLNNSSFTSTQWAAINSSITSALVTQISTNQSDIANLQQTMVTASSTNTFTNKTIDAEGTGNSITNLKTTNFKSGVIVTTVGATGSDTTLPTEQAVREALTALDSTMLHKITANNSALTASGGVCTWTISNTLATADVGVHVYEVSSNEEVAASVAATSSTITIKINSVSNIVANTYRAVIIG